MLNFKPFLHDGERVVWAEPSADSNAIFALVLTEDRHLDEGIWSPSKETWLHYRRLGPLSDTH